MAEHAFWLLIQPNVFWFAGKLVGLTRLFSGLKLENSPLERPPGIGEA